MPASVAAPHTRMNHAELLFEARLLVTEFAESSTDGDLLSLVRALEDFLQLRDVSKRAGISPWRFALGREMHLLCRVS